MKVIAFENDTKRMAIRFLSQEIRLMKPGCNILVIAATLVKLENLCKVDYCFLTEASACEVTALNGTLYILKGGPEQSMKDYHAEVMTLLPEILA
jgi:hypothetical protein